jgi:hypothetical protein
MDGLVYLDLQHQKCHWEQKNTCQAVVILCTAVAAGAVVDFVQIANQYQIQMNADQDLVAALDSAVAITVAVGRIVSNIAVAVDSYSYDCVVQHCYGLCLACACYDAAAERNAILAAAAAAVVVVVVVAVDDDDDDDDDVGAAAAEPGLDLETAAGAAAMNDVA